MNIEDFYKKGCITTNSGKLISLVDPNIEDINIEDIAFALSNINRFNGHTKRPISVLSHSINVCLAAPSNIKLEALLHDAHEAYIGDASTPLKFAVPELAKFDKFWAGIIAKKFNLSVEKLAEVKKFDNEQFEKEVSCSFLGDESQAIGHYPTETFVKIFKDLYFG